MSSGEADASFALLVINDVSLRNFDFMSVYFTNQNYLSAIPVTMASSRAHFARFKTYTLIATIIVSIVC